MGAYGNIGRTWSVIKYAQDVSAANSAVQITSANFTLEPGKKRVFRLSFLPPLCGQTGNCNTNPCDMTGDKVEMVQRSYEITECIASPVYRLAKDDVRLLDNQWNFSETFRQIILSAMPDMRRRIATAMTTKLYAMAGVHLNGNATKRITTTNASNGVVNPIGRYDIEREYLDGGLGSPYLLGGQEVYNWQNMVSIGGMNASGQNIGALSTNHSYYDEGLSDTVKGDTSNGGWVLSIDPQTFKFVTYSDNSGIFTTGLVGMNDIDKLYKVNGFANLLEGNYYDPVTGLVFDLYIKYDCGYWDLVLKLNWDFLLLPNVACNAQGVNGIMMWRTCPPVLAPCPSGSPLPSPTTPVLYSWTPTMADIPSVSTVDIGGVSWVSQTPVPTPTIAALCAVLNDAYGAGKTVFTVSTTKIQYTGFSAMTGSINGTETVTFAP